MKGGGRQPFSERMVEAEETRAATSAGYQRPRQQDQDDRLSPSITDHQRVDGTPAALTLLVRCLAQRAAAECMRRNTASPTSNQDDHNG